MYIIYRMELSKVNRGIRPIRPSNLTFQAHEAIIEAILDHQLEPGTRLSVPGLAEQLAMSATPVREALAHVVGQRLVVQHDNRGFMVAPLLSEREFHELFSVRQLLEIHALTVATFEKDVIERLAELVQSMPAMESGPTYKDFREFNRADNKFHQMLVSMAKNGILLRSWQDLHFHLHIGRLYAGSGVIDFADGLREHAAIVGALQEGDRECLIEIATCHIEHAEHRLACLVPKSAGG